MVRMSAVVALAKGWRLEAELAEQWARGVAGALRLEDGRVARVVFPGIPGPGVGPDFRDALIEVDGDLVRGDVELHLEASGWFAHGHHRDPAFSAVILHVIARNDSGMAALPVAGRTPIPVVVLHGADESVAGEAFVPPCVFARERIETGAVLERLGERRLRMKAARIAPLLATASSAGVLYGALLEILGGPSNRAAFASLGRQLPLALLLERAERETREERALAIAAELRYAAASLVLRRAGMRPMASPGRRLEVVAGVVHRLWPAADASWPECLSPESSLLVTLRAAGLSRSLAIEAAVNAILPVLLASKGWPEAEILAAWHSLPSPGTYGKLKRLQGWLTSEPGRPFASASRLQGGILLHAEYCAKGRCGRCPLS